MSGGEESNQHSARNAEKQQNLKVTRRTAWSERAASPGLVYHSRLSHGAPIFKYIEFNAASFKRKGAASQMRGGSAGGRPCAPSLLAEAQNGHRESAG